MKRQINCPHCKSEVVFEKTKTGRVSGTLLGGAVGYGLASKIGIAGAIMGVSVAIPATLIGVGLIALIGNKFGKEFDNSQPKCPKCKKRLVL